MLYCLMFEHSHPETSVLIPGIYSIKLLFGNDYDCKLKCNNTSITDFNAYKEEFSLHLSDLLSRLFSPEQPFTQAPSEKNAGLVNIPAFVENKNDRICPLGWKNCSSVKSKL